MININKLRMYTFVWKFYQSHFSVIRKMIVVGNTRAGKFTLLNTRIILLKSEQSLDATGVFNLHGIKVI